MPDTSFKCGQAREHNNRRYLGDPEFRERVPAKGREHERTRRKKRTRRRERAAAG